MDYQDIVFLSSKAGFCMTLNKNGDSDESHRTARCPKTVVRSKQG